MDQRVTAAIYPYDLQFTPLLRHKEMIKDFDIIRVISPFCWGLCGKDAGFADRGPDLGILVESDFDQAISDCDTVVFVESEYPFDYETALLPKIRKAILAGNDIAMARALKKEQYDELKELCGRAGVSFTYYHAMEWIKVEFTPRELKYHRIHKNSVPVIFVSGDGERTRKFEVQLSLREKFLQEGYLVSQIGSREYCELLGFHSLPLFLWEERSETEKIYLFNQYVKNIEIHEHPDVIIIGIPGGIMAQSDQNSTFFGITAYEISNAVAPDAAVFCTYYAGWKPAYFEKMCEVIKYRLGCVADCFVLSNARIDWNGSADTANDSRFYHIGQRKVEQRKAELSEVSPPVFDILQQEDREKVAGLLLDKLMEYAAIDHF